MRAIAEAGEVALVDLAGAGACGRRAGRVRLAAAAETLRTACARAGEWHAEDPAGGLCAGIRFRVEASGPPPRLMSGARLEDPPALVVPAGGPPRGPVALDDLRRILPAGCRGQGALLDQARRAGRVSVVEVALGRAPVVTAHRIVPLHEAATPV